MEEELLIFNADEVKQGESIILAICSLWILMKLPEIVWLFFNVEGLNFGIIDFISSFGVEFVILSSTFCIFYSGNRVAKWVFIIYMIKNSIITIGSIRDSSIYTKFLITPQIAVFLLVAIIVIKSKSVAEFMRHRRAVNNDKRLKFYIETFRQRIYIGKIVVMSWTFICTYKVLSITISMIALISSNWICLLNSELNHSYITYFIDCVRMKNIYILTADFILQLSILIVTYKVYKKKILIRNINILILFKIIFNIIAWFIGYIEISTFIVELFEWGVIIGILFLKRNEIDGYINSEIN